MRWFARKAAATLPLALALAGCGDAGDAQGRSLPQERRAVEEAPLAKRPAPGPEPACRG